MIPKSHASYTHEIDLGQIKPFMMEYETEKNGASSIFGSPSRSRFKRGRISSILLLSLYITIGVIVVSALRSPTLRSSVKNALPEEYFSKSNVSAPLTSALPPPPPPSPLKELEYAPYHNDAAKVGSISSTHSKYLPTHSDNIDAASPHLPHGEALKHLPHFKGVKEPFALEKDIPHSKGMKSDRVASQSKESLSGKTSHSNNMAQSAATLKEPLHRPKINHHLPAMDYDQVLPHTEGAKIGMATIKYGDGNRMHKLEGNEGIEPKVLYSRSIDTMKAYGKKWGYPVWIGRHRILEGPENVGKTDLWSKETFVLSVIINELRKPEGKRLDWIFFADADVVYTNPNVPLDTFVPPDNDFGRSHSLLASIDRWGSLNSGGFFVRVSQDGIILLTALLSYPYTKNSEGKWISQSEQSAMAALCGNTHLREKIAVVPPHWFNADIIGTYSPWVLNAEWLNYQPGDLLIHFLTEHKTGWNEVLDEVATGTNTSMLVPLSDTRYKTGTNTVADFWEEWEALGSDGRLLQLDEASKNQD